MFETKVMGAPNSPIALAKHRIMPAMIPGRISGKVTNVNTQSGLAPSVPAASSRRRSTASIDRRIDRTSSGNAITAQARAAPVQAEEEQIAGDDGRQDERQQHDAVDDRFSGETAAREQVGDGDADRQ